MHGSIDDLVGMDDIKAEVAQIKDQYQRRAAYAEYGISKPFNVMFSGPAGTGKTKLASYLAKELNLPILFHSAANLETGFVAGGSGTLSRIAAMAKRRKRCIVFLDEAQDLFMKRGGHRKFEPGTTGLVLEVSPGGSIAASFLVDPAWGYLTVSFARTDAPAGEAHAWSMVPCSSGRATADADSAPASAPVDTPTHIDLTAPADGAVWPAGGTATLVWTYTLPDAESERWPVVSLGRIYNGSRVSEQSWWQPGIEMPVMFWMPAISPSSVMIYTGDKFPLWRGHLFIGALSGQQLQRVAFDQPLPQFERREALLVPLDARVRDVRQGPDGLIYVLVERDLQNGPGSAQLTPNGSLLRIEPAT